MTQYICIKDGKFHAGKVKKGDIYWVRTSSSVDGRSTHYHLYIKSNKHISLNQNHFLDGFAHKIGIPEKIFNEYLISIEKHREDLLNEILE